MEFVQSPNQSFVRDAYAAGYTEAIERFNKIFDNFFKDLERFILEIQSQLPKTNKLLAGC
jgi:hypothetical protein